VNVVQGAHIIHAFRPSTHPVKGSLLLLGSSLLLLHEGSLLLLLQEGSQSLLQEKYG